MTYVKLIQHGLRMLMPFADRIATRGLVVLAVSWAAGMLGAAALLTLKVLGYLAALGWTIYALCTAAVLSTMAAAALVIVFALFVQAQGLSLAQLDNGRRRQV